MRNELSLNQTLDLISATGNRRTVLVQGHMGTGKSSLLSALSERFPAHRACYFDCTTKDLGDITLPRIADGTAAAGGAYVQYATNEELGAHHREPIILMIDEFGKSNPGVKLALLRLMLERKIGSYTLHPDSIIFATTNLGSEGVGDLLPAHARNRLTVVGMRKPTPDEWLVWGIGAGLDPALLGWVKDTPCLFDDFRDLRDIEGNPYIFHPNAVGRDAFVTPRSLAAASDILAARSAFDENTLLCALAGTIGTRGAADLLAFVRLADKLPKLQDIMNNPMGAMVPENVSALCLVVFKVLASLDDRLISPWMDYMSRLPLEAQALFVNNARNEKYKQRNVVFTNKKFMDWAMKNNYLFV
jgi:MoxR-like ATPase